MRRRRGWKVWAERSGKNWRCRWRDHEGMAHQRIFVLRSDAEALVVKKRREFELLDAGLPPAPDPGQRPRFKDFRDDYLRWLGPRRAARTAYNAERALDLWAEFAGERFPVLARHKVASGGKTADDFCAWFTGTKKKRDGTEQHINHLLVRLRHLKAGCRWAYKHGYVDYDPFLHFEMPPAVKVARLLKPKEVTAILKELPEVCQRAMVFVLYTGLRVSEVLQLDWAGIERGRQKWYLTVLKSKTRREQAETKTQAIHPAARAVLGTPKAAGKVFELKLSRMEQRLRAAVIKLGLGRVRWHDLRHTWATYLMQEAKDLKAVMDAGGWATKEAAMQYQHGTDQRRDVTLKNRFPAPSWPLNARGAKAGNKRKVLEK